MKKMKTGNQKNMMNGKGNKVLNIIMSYVQDSLSRRTLTVIVLVIAMLMLPAGVDVKKLKVKVAVDNIIMVIMRDQVMTLVVDQAMVQVLAQVPEDSSTKS